MRRLDLMVRTDYPILDLTTDGVEVVPHQRVDVEALGEQLTPIRDALLELFEGGPKEGRVSLQRLEVGLAVTRDGRIAFATGNATPSLTLTFERRSSSSGTRATKARPRAAPKSDVVNVD